MCEQTDSANAVRDAAHCLAKACIEKTPKSYRGHLNDTLLEGLPDWAADLLRKLD